METINFDRGSKSTETQKHQQKTVLSKKKKKKKGRPFIGIDRVCTLTRVYYRIRDRNNM